MSSNTPLLSPAPTPGMSASDHALASEALAKKDFVLASQHINAALDRDAQDAVALAQLADVYAGTGQMLAATNCIILAMKADPDSVDYKRIFLRFAGQFYFKTNDPTIEFALRACLETPEIELEGAYLLWSSTLLSIPFFKQLEARIFWRDVLNKIFPFRNPFAAIDDFRPLFYPHFILAIPRLVFRLPRHERFMYLLRRFLLDQTDSATPKLAADKYLELTAAVARNCFLSNYIMEVTAEEQKLINALRVQIESTAPGALDPQRVAVFATYEPLYSLTNAESIGSELAKNETLSLVVQEQITDYFDLQRLASSTEALTPVTDIVSESVKQQYEVFPYPRWTELGEPLRTWVEKDPSCLTRQDATALIAGCGTGFESCQLASTVPNAQVLAIDITRASLAYARKKAAQYGLDNVTFRQADILQLGTIDRTFDYVQSFGVLHHMNDPEQGWATITRLLRPGGYMYIGLYSKLARRSVAAARAAIAKGKYPATPEGMRRFRKDSPKLLNKATLQALLSATDYYSLNMYRDLVFHVHEDCFDIPRIKAALKNLGLNFEGFRLKEPVLAQFHKMFPDDPQGLNLDYWHQFELVNPDTFLGCYAIWCRKPVATAPQVGPTIATNT